MKRNQSDYATRDPDKRRLRIYATDPMTGRRAPYRITIEIPNEIDLERGPRGQLVEVYDYDAWNERFYASVDLNERPLLMEAGLPQSESDPRFHQQMVYAVAMKVTDSAVRALGRNISLSRKRRPLRLFPHAFYGRNAFFDPDLNAILFGYFKADINSPGQNIPSQTVFTCLSHDIIAHEMTHAIVHRLRPYFLEPSNVDVLAFHEAFSDIVALFQRFSYRELLAEHIQASEGELQKSKMLVELAQQFGQAMGSGKGLRSAIDEKPHPGKLAKTHEAHERGAILLAAIFAGYIKAFQNRTADLLRIATGGSGELPGGRLHPDLVNRLATEAAQLSDRFLRMCFRAFDYMPPVDVTFGDFLRALVTSDFELNPADPGEVRFETIEAFRERGIYPSGVQSLAEEALLWPSQINGVPERLPDQILAMARDLLTLSAEGLDQARVATRHKQSRVNQAASLQSGSLEESGEQEAGPNPSRPKVDRDAMFPALHQYALNNADAFGLDRGRTLAVISFHATHRITAEQRLAVEFVAQFMQTEEPADPTSGELPFRGGATVIFGSDGAVRYIASKPMNNAQLPKELNDAALARRKATASFVEGMDARDANMAFADATYISNRMKLRSRFRALHEGA
jgi:hypothetical protein